MFLLFTMTMISNFQHDIMSQRRCVPFVNFVINCFWKYFCKSWNWNVKFSWFRHDFSLRSWFFDGAFFLCMWEDNYEWPSCTLFIYLFSFLSLPWNFFLFSVLKIYFCVKQSNPLTQSSRKTPVFVVLI